jgi:hypothetical protein
MNIIERLTTSDKFPLREQEIVQLCLSARSSFMNQPMLLDIKAPLNICGKLINFLKLHDKISFQTLNR